MSFTIYPLHQISYRFDQHGVRRPRTVACICRIPYSAFIASNFRAFSTRHESPHKSPEVQLQLSTAIHPSPPPPSPLHNALPPSPPSSNRASDALALANGNADFAQIFKFRNHSSLKRRRNIIASISSSHAELVSILLDLITTSSKCERCESNRCNPSANIRINQHKNYGPAPNLLREGFRNLHGFLKAK
jgi:hypothetical protein